jgi:hypothetical protein
MLDARQQGTAASRPAVPARSKDELEIQKLQLEIRYIKRSFFVQLLNPICIIAIGLSVLFLYQRPSLEQTELVRLSNEKIQVGNMLHAAQDEQDDAKRQRRLDQLSVEWPQYPQVAAIALANKQELEAKEVIQQRNSELKEKAEMQEVEHKIRCTNLSSQIAGLKPSVSLLEIEIRAEKYLGDAAGSVGKIGQGPIMRALELQASRVKLELDRARAEFDALSCASLAGDTK